MAPNSAQQAEATTHPNESSVSSPPSVEYAGFWARVGAALIDGVILMVMSFVTGILAGVAYAAYIMSTGASLPIGPTALGRLGGGLVGWIYTAGFESSSWQATPGKMALGVKVTDWEGRQIGFWRATGRQIAEILCFLTLFIGYLIVVFTEKKQALHDKVSSCLVVEDSGSNSN